MSSWSLVYCCKMCGGLIRVESVLEIEARVMLSKEQPPRVHDCSESGYEGQLGQAEFVGVVEENQDEKDG